MKERFFLNNQENRLTELCRGNRIVSIISFMSLPFAYRCGSRIVVLNGVNENATWRASRALGRSSAVLCSPLTMVSMLATRPTTSGPRECPPRWPRRRSRGAWVPWTTCLPPSWAPSPCASPTRTIPWARWVHTQVWACRQPWVLGSVVWARWEPPPPPAPTRRHRHRPPTYTTGTNARTRWRHFASKPSSIPPVASRPTPPCRARAPCQPASMRGWGRGRGCRDNRTPGRRPRTPTPHPRHPRRPRTFYSHNNTPLRPWSHCNQKSCPSPDRKRKYMW